MATRASVGDLKFKATENANRYRLLAFPIPSNFGMRVERPLLVVPRTRCVAVNVRILNCFKKPRRACTMKKLTGYLAGGCLVLSGLVAGAGVAAAQDGAGAGTPPPPK